MSKMLIDASKIPDNILDVLLIDRTRSRDAKKYVKNIIWATSGYSGENNEITKKELADIGHLGLQPRVLKRIEIQKSRTKSKAEVFTPSWLCNEMNNYCDDDWFDDIGVFNTPDVDNKSWKYNRTKIWFKSNNKRWKDYVLLKKIEITCGEAPYIVSRYDTTTGKPISIMNRIGFLDRKLRVINENAANYDEWFYWVVRAYQNTYGYEWQGDSLLIARINLFLSFIEYMNFRWKKVPSEEEAKIIATIISWNIWQMDGLKYTTVWNEGLERKEIESKRQTLVSSIEKISECDFSEKISLESVALIARYSGDIPAKTYSSDELINELKGAGYLPSIIESFANLLTDVKVKPGNLKEMQRRKERVMQKMKMELDSIDNHSFSERMICVIHQWIPCKGNLMKANRVAFIDILRTDNNQK